MDCLHAFLQCSESCLSSIAYHPLPPLHDLNFIRTLEIEIETGKSYIDTFSAFLGVGGDKSELAKA